MYPTRSTSKHRYLLFIFACGLLLTGAILGLLTVQSRSAFAVSCSVPSASYPTIQSAVDDTDCTEIDIAAGTYTETVTIKRDLTMRGAGDQLTILDGENDHRPLVVGLSDTDVVDTDLSIKVYAYIEDLAVRNGNATTESPSTPPVNSGRIGGGLLVRNLSAAYLTNVRVYDSIARVSGTGSGFGGGIGVYGASRLHAENVRVYRNKASTGPINGFGGGIAALGSTVYMTNTYVYQNKAKDNTGGQGQGGGIYVENFATNGLLNPSYARIRIRDSEIYSNTAVTKGGAGIGGGLYAGETDDTHVWLYDNLWRDNVARGADAGSGDGYGGAVAVDVQTQGTAYLEVYRDEFRNNAANAVTGLTSSDKAHGGAVYLDANATNLLTATLDSPYFASNYAESGSGSTNEQGGALYTRFSKVTWVGGKATGNKADRNNSSGQGGAVRTLDAPLSIYEVEMYDNVANEGGAVYSRNDDINLPGYLRMRNVMAADNVAPTGAAVYFADSNNTEDSWLRHVTIADEDGNPGQAVHVVKGNIEIKNSIIADHATGIQSAVPQASEDYNLFSNNTNDTGGATGSGGNSITGNPQFSSPVSRNYHIGSASDARDIGTDLGIATDIDGEPRDTTPDAGADEYTAATPTPTSTATATFTPTQTSTPTATSTQVPTYTNIAINEVYYVGDINSDWVEIKNMGTGTYDVSNWWLCSEINYGKLGDMQLLSGTLTLAPGEIAVVRAWKDLNNAAADLGLYKDNNGAQPSFASPEHMIDFLQWGTSNLVGRSAVAGSKGLWREIEAGVYDYVPTAGAGESAAYDGTNGGGGTLTYATDFFNGAPSQGSENPVAVETPTPTATATSMTPTATGTSTPTATPTPKTVTVNVRSNLFEPATVTIQVGDTVEWKRVEGFHNVRADNGIFRLGDANGDVSNTWDTVSFTFTEPGTYPYYCEAHGAPGGTGMSGMVIVEAPPTPTATSAPSETPSETPDGTPSPSSTPGTPTPSGTPSPSTTPGSSSTPSASETPSTTPSPSATPQAGVPSDVVLNEIYYTSDANGDWIELKNTGSGQVDVSSWQMCARFSYKLIGDMAIIDPSTGQRRSAAAGDYILGPGEYLVLKAWMDLTTSSDMAIYTSSDFASPSALVDFVQWGTPDDVGRADVAAAKGIWPETSPGQYDFVPAAASGQSLALTSSNKGTAAADFGNRAPTQGRGNSSSSSSSKKIFLPLVER